MLSLLKPNLMQPTQPALDFFLIPERILEILFEPRNDKLKAEPAPRVVNDNYFSP
jgi:hypothetical protein